MSSVSGAHRLKKYLAKEMSQNNALAIWQSIGVKLK